MQRESTPGQRGHAESLQNQDQLSQSSITLSSEISLTEAKPGEKGKCEQKQRLGTTCFLRHGSQYLHNGSGHKLGSSVHSNSNEETGTLFQCLACAFQTCPCLWGRKGESSSGPQ